MSRRRLAIGLVCVPIAASAVLFLAGIGNAGTNNTVFQGFALPSTLHINSQGLAVAKFQPDPSSGAATHTVIKFVFGVGTSGVAPDPVTSPDCTLTSVNVVSCNIGTVNPGQLVRRYVTFNAGNTTGTASFTVSITYDNGSGGAKGGGSKGNLPDPQTKTVTLVDGTSDAKGQSQDGACVSASGGTTDGSIGTAGLSTTVLQQTQLKFGGSSLPCSWATVGVIKITGKTGPGGGAPAISSVDGAVFANQAELTLTFSSLPSHYVLKWTDKDPSVATPNDWQQVPPCPAPPGVPLCLVGYDKGKPIVAHLLFQGTGVDPFMN